MTVETLSQRSPSISVLSPPPSPTEKEKKTRAAKPRTEDVPATESPQVKQEQEKEKEQEEEKATEAPKATPVTPAVSFAEVVSSGHAALEKEEVKENGKEEEPVKENKALNEKNQDATDRKIADKKSTMSPANSSRRHVTSTEARTTSSSNTSRTTENVLKDTVSPLFDSLSPLPLPEWPPRAYKELANRYGDLAMHYSEMAQQTTTAYASSAQSTAHAAASQTAQVLMSAYGSLKQACLMYPPFALFVVVLGILSAVPVGAYALFLIGTISSTLIVAAFALGAMVGTGGMVLLAVLAWNCAVAGFVVAGVMGGLMVYRGARVAVDRAKGMYGHRDALGAASRGNVHLTASKRRA